MTVRIVPARPEHIVPVAADMRLADVREVQAWSGVDPETALRGSLAGSAVAWCGLLDDAPFVLFGVSGAFLSPLGVPWMLATPDVDRVPRAFARMSLTMRDQMLAMFPALANWSDARHDRAHAWLSWLGFSLGEPRPMGLLGLPFRPFGMEVRHV